jgi:CheY-like chemotaxis protein
MQEISPPAAVQEGNKSVQHPVILVIDDHPAIRDMLSWWLLLQGYQPACTANGLEALKWLEQTQQSPQAILLDQFMPVMDGREFLAALRTQWGLPLPPIILLTVERNAKNQLPCSSVLMKPFHLQELRDCLRRVTETCF